MFKHIAVGCDGSHEGRDAVALGAAIASATGARLSLVGVFPPSFLPVEGVTDRKTLRTEATRALRRERDLLAPDAFIHTVADMSVARALRHYAERSHADLVIVGSSRSAPPGHVAIGRHGRQLLYDAPFALGLAARDLHEHGMRLGAVGVGYDGGPEAEAALGMAADLARAADARLLVRRVVEDRVPVLGGDAWIAMADWSHEQMWETARQNALAQARETGVGAGRGQRDVRHDRRSGLRDPGTVRGGRPGRGRIPPLGPDRTARNRRGRRDAGQGCQLLDPDRPPPARQPQARREPPARASAGSRLSMARRPDRPPPAQPQPRLACTACRYWATARVLTA